MKILIPLFLFITLQLHAQEYQLKVIELPVPASFRGLSVVDENVVWTGGTMGTVCRSVNSGQTFNCMLVPGDEKADFRSVFAFDSSKAIIANVGSPAKIFLTEDGGSVWKEVYVNNHKDAFIDGVDFWDANKGIAFGDPIDGKLLVLRTEDGGKSWNELPTESRPSLEAGEASFAASGTTIRCFENGKVIIATGGKISRLLASDNFGITWTSINTPIIQGESSTGIFSFDFINRNQGTIVGGDYMNDSLTTNHVFMTNNRGFSWNPPVAPTRGYRECVMFLDKKTILAVGPNGMDISFDEGENWKPFSDRKKFHAVKKSKNGKLVILSGSNGQIGILFKTASGIK